MLSIVGTPIGNLDDLSPRALETLRACDLIAAEDTRHSAILLQRHQLRKPLVSLHEHNEARRTDELLGDLRAGKHVALVSDAGLPGICDPGARLVAACHRESLPLQVIPGPSALATALAGSGFDGSAFHFGGFLPPKSGGRANALAAAAGRPETTIVYETPHRLLRALEQATLALPDRLVCVARELTKHFEEFRVAHPAELLAHYTAHPPKGEIVLVIEGADEARRRQRKADKPTES
jgi:16S rRNA (cytidine1402-2'-O)-methyltransferase